MSAWAVYANGVPWDLLNGGIISYDAARIFLVNRAAKTEDGLLLARTIGLVIGRAIGGGMHEDLDVTNGYVATHPRRTAGEDFTRGMLAITPFQDAEHV